MIFHDGSIALAIKIPLGPPFSNGEILLPFVKGGREGFNKSIL